MKNTRVPILSQLLIVASIVIMAFALTVISTDLIFQYYAGISPDKIPFLLATPPSQKVIDAFKISQLAFTLCVFLLPAIALPAFLYRENPLAFLKLKTRSSVWLYALIILIFYVSIPVFDLAAIWNAKLKLATFMHNIEAWMQQGEDASDKMTEYFIRTNGWGTLIANIFVMALLPAIAEEFMFRGFIQRILVSWTKRPHLAILLSAAIFSFIHFQFYGFVPRMLLGMLFGYLFYWSGDIKLPIFAHFINNFVGVMAAYYHPENIDIKPEDLPMNHVYIYYLSLLALGVLVFAFYWLSRSYHKSVEDNLKGKPDRWVKIYTSPQTFEAEIIVGNLESEGIEAVVVNKKSSSYTVFGEAEVHVHEIDAERAKEIIIKAGNPGEGQS